MVDQLSVELLQRLRRKIGDQHNTPPAFDESELQDIWQETGGNWNKTVLTCYEELIGASWRFHNYTQNQTKEEKGKIFDNLKAVHAMWQAKVDAEAASATKQTALARLGVRKRVKRTD